MIEEGPDLTTFEWEVGLPDRNVWGFKVVAGNLVLTLGYAVYPNQLYLLYCAQSIGTQPHSVWRRFWVTPHSALESAEMLCAEAEEYAESIGIIRPYEDLDLEDFMEHLTLSITNGLH